MPDQTEHSKQDIILRWMSGILVPLAIFIVGILITVQQYHSDKVQHSTDRIAMMLDHLVSENPQEQLLAVEFIKHSTEEDDSNRELLAALLALTQTETDVEVGRAVENVLAERFDKNREDREFIESTLEEIKPRVYILIAKPQQMEHAKRVRNRLRDEGMLVPAIEEAAGDPPDVTQLRYFRKSEREKAIAIVHILESLKMEVHLTDLSEREGIREEIKFGQFELWFAR